MTKIYIDREVADASIVREISSRLSVETETIKRPDKLYKIISDSKEPVKKAKTSLLLTKNRGAFIKDCPGTSVYNCCGYKILNIGTFCSMDCSYCILQAYFHPPVLQYFVNHDDMFSELDALLLQKKRLRIGTGEFTDSLIWERYSDLSTTLVQKFAKQDSAVLELKTKTVNIEKLKGQDHRCKTILAWSLNTETAIESEEQGTASLSARLRAAAKCEQWGYRIAFHFDPIFIYEGCEKEYIQVIERIFRNISADKIVWISLGTFRFMPELKPIIEQRFKKSKIVYGEFITGMDRKMRYFKPLRIKLYKKLISCIRELSSDVTVYFCMEDDEVWEKTLGFKPKSAGGLGLLLDQSAEQKCRLKAY